VAGDVFVGVLRATVIVPGARSLKDRRQVVRSLRDRVRSRFHVTFHEVGGDGHPGQQVVVVTTAGNDGDTVREVLASVRRFLEMAPDSFTNGVDVDVFPWHPGRSWMEDEELFDG
jgi:uncharacterized protein YlxP (DUF503 family)